jgi:predicted CxxxxCH...CXXCH cytochrome family protein
LCVGFAGCGDDSGTGPTDSGTGDTGTTDTGTTDTGTTDSDTPDTDVMDSDVVDAPRHHPEGWADPAVHGSALAAMGIAVCQECHGDELMGGEMSPVSCTGSGCHDPGWETNCTHCHGGMDNDTGAPPEGFAGSLSDLAAGAHTAHVEETDKHAAWDCAMCHNMPTDVFSEGHIDGDARAEVNFGTLNDSGAYDGAGGCSDLYCHGNGSTLGASPSWDTDPDLGCGDCHANVSSPVEADVSAMSGRHHLHVIDQGLPCTGCHADTTDGTGIIDVDLHVNGTADVSEATWDPAGAGTCTAACHSTEVRDWN